MPNFQEHILRAALELIADKDPCPAHSNPETCQHGRIYTQHGFDRVRCIGCIARAALNAYDREVIHEAL